MQKQHKGTPSQKHIPHKTTNRIQMKMPQTFNVCTRILNMFYRSVGSSPRCGLLGSRWHIKLRKLGLWWVKTSLPIYSSIELITENTQRETQNRDDMTYALWLPIMGYILTCRQKITGMRNLQRKSENPIKDILQMQPVCISSVLASVCWKRCWFFITACN